MTGVVSHQVEVLFKLDVQRSGDAVASFSEAGVTVTCSCGSAASIDVQGINPISIFGAENVTQIMQHAAAG